MYFVAVGTLDELLWKLLEKKFWENPSEIVLEDDAGKIDVGDTLDDDVNDKQIDPQWGDDVDLLQLEDEVKFVEHQRLQVELIQIRNVPVPIPQELE